MFLQEKQALQGICASLRHGSRNGTGEQLSPGVWVLVSLWSQVFADRFVGHEIEPDLTGVSDRT